MLKSMKFLLKKQNYYATISQLPAQLVILMKPLHSQNSIFTKYNK